MNFRKLLNEESGFTLIEVLASIVIFSIVTFSMLQFFSHAYSYTKKNEDKTLGIYVAKNMLNYLEKQSFTNIKKQYADPLPQDPKKETTLGIEACKQKNSATNEPVFTNTTDGTATSPSTCESMFLQTINNRKYTVSLKIRKYLTDQDQSQNLIKQAYLVPVTVTVNWDNQNAVLEGYITSEKIR